MVGDNDRSYASALVKPDKATKKNASAFNYSRRKDKIELYGEADTMSVNMCAATDGQVHVTIRVNGIIENNQQPDAVLADFLSIRRRYEFLSGFTPIAPSRPSTSLLFRNFDNESYHITQSDPAITKSSVFEYDSHPRYEQDFPDRYGVSYLDSITGDQAPKPKEQQVQRLRHQISLASLLLH